MSLDIFSVPQQSHLFRPAISGKIDGHLVASCNSVRSASEREEVREFLEDSSSIGRRALLVHPLGLRALSMAALRGRTLAAVPTADLLVGAWLAIVLVAWILAVAGARQSD